MAEAGWGRPDELDRTARQVRQGNAVHALDRADFKEWTGRRYWGRCGELLLAENGAVLTTDAPSCWACVPGGVS
jgi:hypothetical protein